MRPPIVYSVNDIKHICMCGQFRCRSPYRFRLNTVRNRQRRRHNSLAISLSLSLSLVFIHSVCGDTRILSFFFFVCVYALASCCCCCFLFFSSSLKLIFFGIIVSMCQCARLSLFIFFSLTLSLSRPFSIIRTHSVCASNDNDTIHSTVHSTQLTVDVCDCIIYDLDFIIFFFVLSILRRFGSRLFFSCF